MSEEWKSTKDELPKAGEQLYLKLYAEYIGSWEPEEEGSKKGQWILEPPIVNTSEWRYLTQEEKDAAKERRKRAKESKSSPEENSKDSEAG